MYSEPRQAADFLPLRPLPNSGTIGVIAPSSPIDQEKLQRGVTYLENKGFTVKIGESCYARETYLAGSDELRAGDLMNMVDDDSIDAVFCARGGFGTLRILHMLDYDLIASKRKMIVGYSDVTALHWAIYARTGLPGFSAGMVASDFGRDPLNTTFEQNFWPLISHGNLEVQLPTSAEGTFELNGTAMAGTLSVATKLLGTPFYPEVADPVCILEDIEEAMHKMEGYFQQLRLSGKFDELKGIILGNFTPDPNDPNKDYASPQEVFMRIFSGVDFPVLSGIDYGHIPPKVALPVGLPIRIDISPQRSTLTLVSHPFQK